MFRTIFNYLAGRKKETDMEIGVADLEKILKLVNEYDLIDGVNIEGHYYGRSKNLKGRSPRQAANYVRDYFSSLYQGEVLDINYQVFTGEKTEKHYFDLRTITSPETENFEKLFLPTREATIDYLLKVRD